jgi:hypothetical protein
MPDELEAPNSPSELYLARGGEVNVNRPLMQGDIFADIEIPGVDDGPGIAAIVTHACSMRQDGVHLTERLLVGRVEVSPDVPLRRWASGHYKILPLPEVMGPGGESFALKYDLCGRVASADLEAAERLACLDPFGICLLLQRWVNHQARVIVPTDQFHLACAHVFEEADLVEEWVEAARSAGGDPDAAAVELHNVLRAPRENERSLQESLLDPAKRAHVRRVVRELIKERFGVGAA